jgi:hypothetical protein
MNELGSAVDAEMRLHAEICEPPAHAAVFCVDEKTAIQVLDRKDPVLPLSPGRAERHGFEYYRHGTLSLYAAFNTKTARCWAQLRRGTHRRSLSPSWQTCRRRTSREAGKREWCAFRDAPTEMASVECRCPNRELCGKLGDEADQAAW